MIHIETSFTSKDVLLAACGIFIESFRWLLLYIVGFSVFVALISNDGLMSAGVLGGYLILALFFSIQFYLNARYISGASREAGVIKYSFSEDDCSVQLKDAAIAFRWIDLAEPKQYLSILLFEIKSGSSVSHGKISRTHARALIDNIKRHIVKKRQNYSGIGDSALGDTANSFNESHKFPIGWLLPVPSRRYLLIPRKAVSNTLLLQICRWIATEEGH